MSYDIRQSQVVHTWPAGAMVDFPEISLIMLCHDDAHADWGKVTSNDSNAKQIIKDSRLAEAFKVDNFILPPVQDGVNTLSTYGIRFPRAHYCPKCDLIHFVTRDMGQKVVNNRGTIDQSMSAFKCERCIDNQTGIGPKLVPMRFVIATEEGFLDDFPWDWYVHKKKPDERRKGHDLYFKSRGGSAGLGDIIIESRRKKDNSLVTSRDLGQIFEQEIFTESDPEGKHYLDYVGGKMSQPWKGWRADGKGFVEEIISDVPRKGLLKQNDELTPEARRKFPRTLQRGAGNIIFPIIYSGILLPESTYEQICPPEIGKMLYEKKLTLEQAVPDVYAPYSKDNWRNFFIGHVNNNPDTNLLSLGYTLAQVIQYINDYFADGTNQFINKAELLRQQEFRAFIGPINKDDAVWFKKKSVPGNLYNDHSVHGLFDEVILLEKLAALKVYRGFTRVKPLMGEELIFADRTDQLDVRQLDEFNRIQDARKKPVITREIPAVEVRGEAIFLKFNNDLLNLWSDNYPNHRLNVINNNLKQANADFGQSQSLINKRYLFLHTFSHILLKELAEDCGYSLSSLSEIIYCSSNDKIGNEDEMNGILIYTTTSDAEGSLGGLVEKGQPNYLSSIIKKGIDKARWCSSDPLCISAEQGQGFMGLNLAACYSCVLLPETTCEKMNKYLDRAAVIGTLNNPDIGLFNK